jgi:hypothetical protein
MPSIEPFLPNLNFSSQLLAIMEDAFGRACKSLQDSGQPKLVQEIIASRIIRLAQSGERDPRKLCEDAVRGLGMHSECERPALSA